VKQLVLKIPILSVMMSAILIMLIWFGLFGCMIARDVVLTVDERLLLTSLINNGVGPGDDPRYEFDCGENCTQMLLELRPLEDISCDWLREGACCVVRSGDFGAEIHILKQDDGTHRIIPKGGHWHVSSSEGADSEEPSPLDGGAEP
jgi:hypothetical protein